jgi:transketolase
MRTIPGMTVISVCDSAGMEQLMPETVKYQGPIYIRLGRGGDPIVPRPRTADGLPMLLRDGDGPLFITHGTMTQVALEAAAVVDARVLYVPVVKPLHRSIFEWVNIGDLVVTIEDHSLIGGLGSAVLELFADDGGHIDKAFARIGYPDVFPHGYGTQDEMRARYGLTAEAIVAQVRKESWVHS